MEIFHSRAGRTVPQGSGYHAFIPEPLPPTSGIVFDNEMIHLLSQADIALGRLSGIADVLPNPDLFVAMYMRKEAVLSSQIEGIQSTLDDVLAAEHAGNAVQTKSIGEVVNYVSAMNYGIERLSTLPLSLRLIREIHACLMTGVTGEHKAPGEFRTTQNWIGPQGCTLATASFVPPPVPDMTAALNNLESFMHDRSNLPLIIQCAIAHLQFETIHPFLDGNGRVGRLLVALMLHERGVLTKPLLYISHYLKANRIEYYDRLMDVRRNGNWEGWIKFFLTGVAGVGHEASETAKRIVAFRNGAQTKASTMGRNEFTLIDHLFRHPILDVRAAEKMLGVSFVTANNTMNNLVKAGLVSQNNAGKRNRTYRFDAYLTLFDDPIPPEIPLYENACKEMDGYVHAAQLPR